MICAAALCSVLPSAWTGDGFDWDRDRVLLRNGSEQRGVVLESCHAEHVVLLREGNRREEIPRADIRSVDKLRDRLASFMAVRRPGLSIAADWSLVEDAQRVGLDHMARLQAYHVLLRDPEHRGAHRFLGHEQASSVWQWSLDGKQVTRERFEELSADWNHRLVLESEHFTLETDCGLRRGLEVLFDLEGLYLWWMEHLGPCLRAAEDVDSPAEEKITFLVHRDREAPGFQPRDSDREPYYDPSGRCTAVSGGFNVARTYFTADGRRPLFLFELGTESLMYSLLVLGRTRDEADDKLRRLSHWAEIGLGFWVAQHCGGEPGYPEIRPPFERRFQLDRDTARMSLQRPGPSHLLRRGPDELPSLVTLPYLELIGDDPDVPLARARCCSFVSFLIEANHTVEEGAQMTGGSRDGLWSYLRTVYCTQQANSSSAFDDGLGGAKVEMLEDAWKAWTAGFASAAPGTR